jgi:arginyl-tRNA synthetase
VGKTPREVADLLAEKLASSSLISKAEVAGPGFINLTVADDTLLAALRKPLPKPYAGKTVVAEYSDPNPFKILHAGHLYTSVVGDAIANLLETAGATVHRVNFGGDVGLHVAKAMWAMLQDLGGEDSSKLEQIKPEEHSEWLAACYVKGTAEYEDSDASKTAIVSLNKRIYKIHAEKDHSSPLAQIYWTTRQWSYDYFDEFYERIGTKFEKYYPESETIELGLETVKKHTGTVFQESQGAVVFDGEKYGLHTRVFINSEGLPTYEAKDVGLMFKKWEDYHFDKSIYITGNEQEQYLSVVFKAIEQFAPELVRASEHMHHGIVKLAGGEKMSSRKGNILRAVDVLDAAQEANKQATGKDDVQITLGAVKYSFLKQRLGGDIIYDPKESVSLQGNSGPYLQYALVRAKSILSKATAAKPTDIKSLDAGERLLARKISQYPEVLEQAVNDLLPSHVATYLYELATDFNRFYENNRVMGDSRETNRLALVAAYAWVLQKGLAILGIPTPERM